MTQWLGFGLMTIAAAFAVLWPLTRRPERMQAGSDVAVYRDQLDEIERDRAGGLIEDQEAIAARTEVSRRLIAAADAQSSAADHAPDPGALGRRRIVAVSALVLLPACALGLYSLLGAPWFPDQPLAPRLAAARTNQSVEALVAQVEAHLARNPDEGRGWEVIAPIYLRLGRFDDAIRARRNALRLNGETAARVAALGEAMVFAANGVVTAEAKTLFEQAATLDGGDVQSHYFLGLAAEQDGDRLQAAAIWRRLIAAAPPDAGWTDFVRGALARVETTGGARGDPGAGPSEEQVAAASELGGEQRNAMIRGMVERLSERLHHDGSDVEGWLRLVRSYMVLGQPDKARAAAGDAKRALADDPTKLKRLDDLVKDLGLEG
jgi:cytochrome c-type biogenesis protein CcmH